MWKTWILSNNNIQFHHGKFSHHIFFHWVSLHWKVILALTFNVQLSQSDHFCLATIESQVSCRLYLLNTVRSWECYLLSVFQDNLRNNYSSSYIIFCTSIPHIMEKQTTKSLIKEFSVSSFPKVNTSAFSIF